VTGAADDDPSGIATYSQAGARFGLQLVWTLVLTYPLMVAIQLVSARIGRVTGHGLATNMRRHYPRSLLYLLVGLLGVANTINIAADLAAMGDALACWSAERRSGMQCSSACFPCCCRSSFPIGATCPFSSG